MSDITTIKRGLAARAQSVAEMLLPAGKKDGSEWRVGSLNGEPGKSLGVHLTGSKAGLWKDFAADDGGDLIDLWMATSGLSLVEVLDRAREYLGMERPAAFKDPLKEFKRPPKPKCVVPSARALDYLSGTRCLSDDAITAYKIGERGDMIVFPYLLPDGTLVMVKEQRAEDGAAAKPTSRDCEKICFGWQVIPDDARTVVIVEGEKDAPSWYDYGHPALSVPFGGGGGNKQDWIENDYERFERFETIYLALDNDDEGDKAAEEIARRLGRHRCRRVTHAGGHKDANDCLKDGVPAEEMQQALDDARALDPEELRKPTRYTDAVIELFWPEGGVPAGYQLPYENFRDKVLFRPGELTLWSGASGAGKSQILSDCEVDWVAQGSRVCKASFEMKGSQSLKRSVKQVSGLDRPTKEYIAKALQFLDRGLIIYERVGKSNIDGLLEIFDYARARWGADQFVVDSLMRLGIASDNYTGQEEAVYKLVDWVISRDVHLHLVAHSRKGERSSGVPEIEDVKGAMEIGANAFNILTVWRNRKREDEINEEDSEDKRRELLAERPMVMLNIAKQRNGDFEGKRGLWFCQQTYRYSNSPTGNSRRCYPIEGVLEEVAA